MQLPNFLKRWRNQDPPEPSQENLEAFDQHKKEEEAYKTEYNKARIEAAQCKGRQDGLTHGLQNQRGSHGIKATLGTISKGLNQVGEFGQQMQKNLSNMFDVDPFNITPKRKKRKS